MAQMAAMVQLVQPEAMVRLGLQHQRQHQDPLIQTAVMVLMVLMVVMVLVVQQEPLAQPRLPLLLAETVLTVLTVPMALTAHQGLRLKTVD